MKKIILSLCCAWMCLWAGAAEIQLNTRNLSEEEVAQALEKSKAIVDKLGLADAGAKENTLNVIANRYLELREIHRDYDQRNAAIEKLGLPKEAMDWKLEESYFRYNSALYRSRFTYITHLSFYLNEEQIEQVRNEMTGNMFFKYYVHFQKQVPQMTEAEKARVRSHLKEAREFAMDFETERKMRQMFIKYRGRINNYLAKCGYDLSKKK